MPSPYQPLADYLAAQPPETVSITLTLAEVAAVVGTPLPAAVWTRTWWSNFPRRPAATRPWAAAGWWVQDTDMRSATPTVTFVRVHPGGSE